VSDASLPGWTEEPSAAPLSEVLRFLIDGIILELYGINDLSKFDSNLLENLIEKLWLDALKSELRYTEFGEVNVEFSYSDKNFFDRLRITLRASVSVRPGLSIALNDQALKYISASIFVDRRKSFLKKIRILQKKGLYLQNKPDESCSKHGTIK